MAYTAIIEKDGDLYAALCPELDVGSHDLAGPLDELRSSRRFSPAEDEAMSILKRCATELGYEQHVRSDYGEEASFRTPWDCLGLTMPSPPSKRRAALAPSPRSCSRVLGLAESAR